MCTRLALCSFAPGWRCSSPSPERHGGGARSQSRGGRSWKSEHQDAPRGREQYTGAGTSTPSPCRTAVFVRPATTPPQSAAFLLSLSPWYACDERKRTPALRRPAVAPCPSRELAAVLAHVRPSSRLCLQVPLAVT
jgi:hypothetical protein